MNQKTKNGIRAAILSMSLVQMSTNGIAPILADLALEFPEASASTIQFLMTFPSLFVIGFSLAAGMLARWVRKKTLSAVGCALVAASGVCSFLFHPSLGVLFLWAGVMGSGVGLVVPMAASLVTDCFEGPERSSMMGLQSGAANAGGMLMAFLGGFLAVLGWRWNYLVYLIALPGLFLSLACLPRTTAPERRDAEHGASGLHGLLAPCVTAVLITMLFNLVPTNLSMYITEHGLGTAAQAGTATTLLLLSGALVAVAFGPLQQRLGGGTVPLGFGLLTVGLLTCAWAPSLPVLLLGSVLSGGSISLVMPQMMLRATARNSGATAMASALVMGYSNLGVFLTPLLTNASAGLFGRPDTGCRFLLGAVLALAVALVQLAGQTAAVKKARAM